MAEFDGFCGLAAFKQFRVFLEEAVQFVISGRHNTLKNPFFGLIPDFLHQGQIMAQKAGFIAGLIPQSDQDIAGNSGNPSDPVNQRAIGGFNPTLQALFGTGAVAGNKIGQFFDFFIVKTMLETQPGVFPPNRTEQTGQRAKTVPQQGGIGGIMDIGFIDGGVHTQLLRRNFALLHRIFR